VVFLIRIKERSSVAAIISYRLFSGLSMPESKKIDQDATGGQLTERNPVSAVKLSAALTARVDAWPIDRSIVEGRWLARRSLRTIGARSLCGI
jgi:hypothetical protein